MLMAVANDDKATFDKLWQWTNSTLKNKENGLFYWRYNPGVQPGRRQKQRRRWRCADCMGAVKSRCPLA
jgi:endo-1,4-beta-D-glucanase Y